MLVIGLTGGIGSGKSTVASIFAEFQIPIIDTDVIAHQLVRPGQTALNEIIEAFGKDILLPNKELDRRKLATITFADATTRHKLEQILHPKIRREVEKQLANTHASYAIIVVPLLAEKGKYDFIDRVLVIDCDETQQITRTMQRDERSKNQIQAIMQSQASRRQRNAIADDIIKNTGNIDALVREVEKLHQFYLGLSKF